MVNQLTLAISDSSDIFINQGLEKLLFDTVNDDEFILYLWTNDDCVVIGKNQDAFLECDVKKLEQDGGKLARRISGGGAVFHNLGNLNFSFISKNQNYNLITNQKIVLEALKQLGIDAKLTGRNDIEVDGLKISGNAYFNNSTTRLHHGTILISSKTSQVAKYLTPNISKFANKKVKSVKSRVANLQTFDSSINNENVSETLINSAKNYFSNAKIVSKKLKDFQKVELDKYEIYFKNNYWRFKENIEYNLSFYSDFQNNKCLFKFLIENNIIKNMDIATDSLHLDFVLNLKKDLINIDIKKFNERLKFNQQNISNEYEQSLFELEKAIWRNWNEI